MSLTVSGRHHRGQRIEAPAGVEPAGSGFADQYLTTRPQDHAYPRADSNRRPTASETATLSSELRGHGARPWPRTRHAEATVLQTVGRPAAHDALGVTGRS